MPSERTIDLLMAVSPPGPSGDVDIWDDLGKEYGRGIFDREGEPITMRQWTALRLYGSEYIVVAQTDIGPYHISTVWLGLDHGFGMSEEPVIFETMVFCAGNPDFDNPQERYCTDIEAIVGHIRHVRQARAFQNVYKEDS